MDYSLVVGVDSQRNELVVGIVGEMQIIFMMLSRFSPAVQIMFGLTHGTRSWKAG
jgi:hypothetical protein